MLHIDMSVVYCGLKQSGQLNKIHFTVRVFCECLSICVCASFPFAFEGGIWGLIVLVPGHCPSFYFRLSHSPSVKSRS